MSWNFHEIDKTIFLFLNSNHTDLLDSIMYSIRTLLFWIPLILLAVFMFTDFRKDKPASHGLVKIIMLFFLLIEDLFANWSVCVII